MKIKHIVMIAVVSFCVAIVLLVGKVSIAKTSEEPNPAAAPVIAETGRKSVSVIAETAIETEQTVIEEPETVIEEPETVIEEPETVIEEPETVIEEPETVIEESETEYVEEPEESEEEPSEHECCTWINESEFDNGLHVWECEECGETEFWEWFEDDEDDQEIDEHECTEFTPVDEDGYYYCIECDAGYFIE